VTDIKVEGGHETVELVKAAGGQAVFHNTDVSQAADLQAAVGRAVETYGGLHIMYNNAAVLHKRDTTVTELEEDLWDLVIGVNLKSVYLGCKYAIPEMTKAGGGSIINISSTAGLVGSPRGGAYTASKGGVRLFTKNTAIQLAPDGIRANSIHPGPIDTEMIADNIGTPEGLAASVERVPLRRIGTVDDVAYGALFLASDEASFMTGSELVIDGGVTAQ
jgi:NAD(P)-dependent dehydrogenase (short-subunit alcohol dehydrogenase family)